MEEKIYLSPPNLTDNARLLVDKAITSNWIAPNGPMVDQFELDLSEKLDIPNTITALQSGTAAIHLACRHLNIGSGDIVLCPSFTFIASISPAIQLGAEVVFIGSESRTWNLCPNALEEAIKYCKKKGNLPKAIVTVSLFGMPYEVDKVHQIAQKYDIPIIEDAAEALGSTYNGKPMGTFGEYSIFSFNGNKIITTSGGGALRVQTAKAKEHTIYLASQAKLPSLAYEHKELGYNYRLSNISAAIGVSQLEVLEKRVHQKRTINQFYSEALSSLPGFEIHKEPDHTFFSNHWLTCFLIDEESGTTNHKIREHLDAKSIESRYLWKPLHTQKVFENTTYIGDGIEVELFKKGLCLPSGTGLQQKDLIRITEVIKSTRL